MEEKRYVNGGSFNLEDETALQKSLIYFQHITLKERLEILEWLESKPETGPEQSDEPFSSIDPKERKERKQEFLDLVREALKVVQYNYYIATIEPSIINGRLAYIEGNNVATGFSWDKCIELAYSYEPKKKSRIATDYELILWYAWRIIKGYWTLDCVVNGSSEIKMVSCEVAKSGTIKHGGFADGQGNTYKLVTQKDQLVVYGSRCIFTPACPAGILRCVDTGEYYSCNTKEGLQAHTTIVVVIPGEIELLKVI